MDIKSTIRDKLIDCDTQLDTLVSYFDNNKLEFCEVIINFVNSNTQLHSSMFAKILACMLGKNCNPMTQLLLNSQLYKLPEILKTCEILDSRRLLAQLEKKLGTLSEKNKKMRGKIQSQINNTKQLNPSFFEFSLTKSKIKVITNNWVNKIPKDKLEFYALAYELDPWKNLANLLHLKPSDFQLDWFLNYVYGGQPPTDSVVYACKNITSNNALELISKYKPDYNFIRSTKVVLSNATKAIISTYTDVNVLLWWLHEFVDSKEALEIINKKITETEINLPYGVLIDKLFLSKKHCTNSYVAYSNPQSCSSMYSCLGWQTKQTPPPKTVNFDTSSPAYKIYEKLLTIAEKQLEKYMLKFDDNKVGIFGDASGSMEVAIKTSSIIMSILCVIANADMNLFRSKVEIIKNPPKNVKDVITFNDVCKANGGTNPASSLEPYYTNKENLDIIIIVTDEEENEKCKNMNFSDMFNKYCETMGKIPKLVFISFLDINRNKKGQMVQEFNTKYPKYEEYIYQYIFDKNKPDLTKLDSVLSKLATL